MWIKSLEKLGFKTDNKNVAFKNVCTRNLNIYPKTELKINKKKNTI